MEFSSKLLEKAVNEMAQLPGIGKRTALRLVLHLLKQPSEQTHFLSLALTTMRDEIKFCANCHNISDVEVCEICNNVKRNHKINRIFLLSVFRFDTLFARRILITMKITEYTQYLFDLWMFLSRILLD